jgi:tetratricopeptide (TPR) repeat protein
MGDLAEAARLTRESLTRFREVLGEKHRYTLTAMGTLARHLTESGSAAEAESLARAALAGLDSANRGERQQYIATLRTLGATVLALRRADEALSILERALDMSRREFGEESERTAHAQVSYGKALVAKGRYAEAAPLLRAAQATLRKHRTDQPRLVAQADAAMAELTARSAR